MKSGAQVFWERYCLCLLFFRYMAKRVCVCFLFPFNVYRQVFLESQYILGKLYTRDICSFCSPSVEICFQIT